MTNRIEEAITLLVAREDTGPPVDYGEEPDHGRVPDGMLARMGVIAAWTLGIVPRSAIDDVPIKRGRRGKPKRNDDALTYAEDDARWLRGRGYSRDDADVAAVTHGLRLAACDAPDAVRERVAALRKRRRQGD